jgi:hypothetical protein
MFTRGGIFIRNPRLVFNGTGDGGEGGNSTPKPFVDEGGTEWGFPAETRTEDMSPEQKAEYWRHKAKKHEKNRKPEDFDTLAEKARKFDEQQDASKPPEQKTIDDAVARGRAEGRSSLLPDAVIGHLRAERPNLTVEQATEIVEDLDLSKFTDENGRLNIEKVTKLAAKFTPGEEKQDPKTPPARQQTLADAVANNGNPDAAGGGGGSIAAMRKQRREALTPTPKA